MVNNINKHTDKHLNLIFSALSDPTRREMVKRLAAREQSIAELASPFDMTKSAVTKHIKILESAGLLKRTISGRVHHCQIQAAPLKEATDWMSFYQTFWDKKLDALDAFLNTTKKDDK